MIGRVLVLCLTGLVLSAAPTSPRPGEVVPWQALFVTVAGVRWVDRAAQVGAESAFDAGAVSPVGAQGPCQFMPGTWREAIKKGWAPAGASAQDPAAAIPAQHRYMIWLEVFCGGFEEGLGGYNAGPGSIRKAQRLAQTLGMTDRSAWLRALPRVTGEAHARETQGYLRSNALYRARIRARLVR